MAAKIFYPYSITFDTTSDVIIDGISSCSINEGGQISRPMLDGEADPRLSFISNYTGAIDFTTLSIKTLLDLVSNSGDCLYGKNIGSDSLVMYSQKALAGGTRETSAVNEKYTINEGVIVPVSLDAGNEGPATLSVGVFPISDGTNNPIVYAGTSALGTSPTPTEVYFCGPVTLNGTAISVQSISIRFGLNVVQTRDNGLADPTMAHIQNRMPIISITTTDIDTANSFARGTAISSTTKVYLRAGTEGGSRQSAASSVHPTFTFTEGIIIRTSLSGSPQTATIEIHPTFDGTNKMMTYSIGAIS